MCGWKYDRVEIKDGYGWNVEEEEFISGILWWSGVKFVEVKHNEMK